MARELVRRVDGIGERNVNAALAGLLSLTSDAMLVFDGAGRILLANDVAAGLFPHGSEPLVGMDVRSLFPPAVGAVPDLPFDPAALPFSVDGTTSRLLCLGADGTPKELAIRADRVGTAGATYILVAHEAHEDAAARSEHERLVGELSRANRRLTGTLNIVLDTLGSQDVASLFRSVIEEITSTMEATGTVLYIAGADGYHLRGMSQSLQGRRVTHYIPFGRMIEKLTTRAGKSLRLRVLPPQRDTLRQGKMVRRDVVDEATREVYKVRTVTLPPFVTFIAVPVWFGGHVIALIEVGWDQAHPTRREDAELMDAVAQYLSLQLAGALATLRSHKEERLDNRASQIREGLMSANMEKDAWLGRSLAQVSDELHARCLEVHQGVGEGSPATVDLPEGSAILDVPLGLDQGGATGGPLQPDQPLGEDQPDQEASTGPDPQVVAVDPASPLGSWLQGRGLSPLAALVDLGEVQGARRTFLLVRADDYLDAEPFDAMDLDFLRTVAHDIHDLARAGEEHRQDRRIAQALQTGMRNELQKVRGISAQGIYSSATATAVIGGDFYDLIALPNRRACVIMGDVSGKGVEAASVSAAVRTALGAYSWQGLSPARMVRLLNDFLLGFSRIETFATLFVGIVDLGAGVLSYCSAGHPPALLVRAATGEVEALSVQSGVVGAFHEMTYRNGRVRLGPGDMLLLYTDGTTEARSPSGAFFGEEGLRDAVMTQAPQGFEGFLDRMLGILDAFTERSLEDDVAMVLLRFDELGAKADLPTEG